MRLRLYLDNRIEQDHRAVKRRVRSMLGFKSADSARVILGGIELIHMMRKQQAKYACNQQLSPSSFTCSPHEGGTMHLLFSRPCSEVATEPQNLVFRDTLA